MLGDVPASNYIGGFKEGVSFALRKCRACLATQDDINTKVHVLWFRNILDNKYYFSFMLVILLAVTYHSTWNISN